jgi:hypothetical protein
MAFSAGLTAAAPTDEAYWQMVGRQFPLDEKMIYLNAANVCPASRPVMDRHIEYLRDFQANPSFQNREKYVEMRERLRATAARMLRVSADEIAVTRNTSEGSNLVVKGIDLKAGDEVIVTEHNHPSNLDSWKVRARRDGFVVKAVSSGTLLIGSAAGTASAWDATTNNRIDPGLNAYWTPAADANGSGNSALASLGATGCDTLITGELREEHFNFAQENHLNLYLCGHYATEVHAVKALAAELSARFGLPWEFIATENPL